MSSVVNSFEALIPSLKGKVFNYSDSEDFAKLWRLDSLPTDRLVVVWTDVAEDPELRPVNAKGCLTPLEWVAVYLRKVSNKGAMGADILVIDLDPISHQSLNAVSYINSLRPDQFPNLTLLEEPGIHAISNWLNKGNITTQPYASLERYIKHIRSSMIDKPQIGYYDRHSISNIISPIVLLGNPSLNSIHSNAFLELAIACGLCPNLEFTGESNIDQSADTAGNGMQVLLVDDQAKLGWTDWIKKVMPNASVTELTSAIPLVQSLQNQLDVAGDAMDLRFRLELPGLEEGTRPVILLDLRLFSGNPKGERTFLKEKLLPLVDRYTDQPGLAWAGFSSENESFRKAREKVIAETLEIESLEHHEVLTWLPRLVALVDMSLPIIIFSSTGRRELMESLKPYGNIITSFEKPRLVDLADAVDIRFRTRNSLEGALGTARIWLQCRAIGSQIRNIGLEPLEEARTAFSNKKHFEIYHDESSEAEKPYFRVTSLIAGFHDRNQANQYDDQFPIRFYGTNCEDKRAVDGNEKGRWHRYWKQIEVKAPPLLLASCVRDRSTQNEGNSDSLFDANGLDNINWDLLSLLWESILADVIPALLKKRKVDEEISISIFGATRQRPIPLGNRKTKTALAMANRLLSKMRDRWGMDLLWNCRVADINGVRVSYPDKVSNKLGVERNYKIERSKFQFLWQSLKTDSFWRIVADVLFGRRECLRFRQISKAIYSAKGEMLVYGADKRPWSTVRHLHYLADLSCSLVDVDLDNETATCRSEPFNEPQQRASVAFRSRLLKILNANRLLDSGDCEAEAITCFASLDHSHFFDLSYLALAERLQECLKEIQGNDLRRLVHLLNSSAKWFSSNRLQVENRIKKSFIPKHRTGKGHHSNRKPVKANLKELGTPVASDWRSNESERPLSLEELYQQTERQLQLNNPKPELSSDEQSGGSGA